MRRLLIQTLLIAVVAVTPASADAILSVSVSGPGGPASATGQFASQAWGRAATGTVFNPNANVFDGLPLPMCCGEALGGHAHAFAKVDGANGLAGARASASGFPDQDETSVAEASGQLLDTLVLFAPMLTLDIDLIGSLFSNITGDAEGSALLSMSVLLRAEKPFHDPDFPFETLYFGAVTRSRDAEGTHWSIGSTVAGFEQGSGVAPPLQLLDSLRIPDIYLGVPIQLSMEVFAAADCREGTGHCSTSANGFDTGHLGIIGNYTSTHAYPGLSVDPDPDPDPPTVPEPATLGLVGLGFAALAGRRAWRADGRADA
jgi:hypothetical protein